MKAELSIVRLNEKYSILTSSTCPTELSCDPVEED